MDIPTANIKGMHIKDIIIPILTKGIAIIEIIIVIIDSIVIKLPYVEW
jgi:hypothetical protein